MSSTYSELARRTEEAGKALRRHAGEIAGKGFAKAAASFSKALAKFEAAIEAAAAGLAPGVRELEALFASPEKKRFTAAALKALHRSVLGAAPAAAADTPAKLARAFLTGVRQQGRGEEALAATRAWLAKTRIPTAPAPADAEALRLELNRLGGLTDEEFALEMEARFSKDADLTRLAKANGLELPSGLRGKEKRAAIVRKVRERAARVHGHLVV